MGSNPIIHPTSSFELRTLPQVQIDEKLKKAIQKKAAMYGVPSSSLIQITLVKAFLEEETWVEGNVFNAHRDSDGKGISIDELIETL